MVSSSHLWWCALECEWQVPDSLISWHHAQTTEVTLRLYHGNNQKMIPKYSPKRHWNMVIQDRTREVCFPNHPTSISSLHILHPSVVFLSVSLCPLSSDPPASGVPGPSLLWGCVQSSPDLCVLNIRALRASSSAGSWHPLASADQWFICLQGRALWHSPDSGVRED